MTLSEDGYVSFPADTRSHTWSETALDLARRAISDPGHRHWLRCGGTWFAGVNLLDTVPSGAINGIPLDGPALDFVRDEGIWPAEWDRAQVSVTYPGYPKQEDESNAAFRYRQARDAAHVDGLHRVGPDRRRYAREYHGFILGLPLTRAPVDAAPTVVWRGSHHIMAQALRAALKDVPLDQWPEVDLTDQYHAARHDVFESCERIALHANPGEAYIIHRMALHGIAPWGESAKASSEGRVIAFFRPATQPKRWLDI